MSWLSIAASFLRDAMSSDEPSAPPQETAAPADIASVIAYVNRLRADTEKNFDTAAQMLRAQNDQLLHTVKIQRRWNYGLTAALVIVAILAAVAYSRGA